MPGKILGLDISNHSITAVQVKSEFKGYQITACARVVIEGNSDLDNALKELFDQMDLKSDTVITSIPEEHVSYRNLQMPFKEPKKIRQTLPFEIETLVPLPIEDLVVDFSIIDQSGQSEILAVSVKKDYLSEYLGRLLNYGIDPEALDVRSVPIVSWLLKQKETPDTGLLFRIDGKRNTMVLYLKRRIALIRTFDMKSDPVAQSFSDATEDAIETFTPEQFESYIRSFCTRVLNTLHSFGWKSKGAIHPEKIYFTGMGALYPETGEILSRLLDIPVEQVNMAGDQRVSMDRDVARVWNPALMDGALALALRDDTRKGRGFNFRKDEFEVKKHYLGFRKEIRKVAVFLLLILSFMAVDLGVDYYLMEKRYRILNQKITGVFRETFPDVKRIVDPVQQMRVNIDELKKSTVLLPGINTNQRVLDLLRDTSRSILKSMDVRVTHMVIDPETVRISGETDSFNTVDNIKNSLEPSTYFSVVTITSANLNRTGKRVQFEIKLQRTS